MDRWILVILIFLAGEALVIGLGRSLPDQLYRSGLISDNLLGPTRVLGLALPLLYACLAAGVIYTGYQMTRPPGEAIEGGPTRVAQQPGEGPKPGGKIIYVCQIFKTTFRDQLCLINADGSGYRRLTTDDNADYNFPSLAPDGKSFVYTVREGESRRYVLYEQTLSGELTQLTEDIEEYSDSAPEISPSGRLIVFNRAFNDGTNTIWVMNRDGSEPRQVFGPPSGTGWDPTWSADGGRILFASDLDGSIQLYSVDLNGDDLQSVSQLQALRGRSDWAPDGIEVATYAGAPWEREIMVMESDGSNVRRLTDGGNNLAPSYSPDGTWIVFTSYRDNYRDDLGCEIYIMRRDGSDVTRLTYNDICDWQARWGP